MRPRTTVALAVASALVAPAVAQAHVTLNPRTVPAGGFVELLVRVPNERDNASTTKVDVQLPPGFAFASYEPKPGWTVKVIKHKLAKPVQTDDGPVTEEVREIIWTGNGTATGKIAPGQFMDFPLSVKIPNAPGTLTFKALQTYSNGEVVRWIGPSNADEPAPRVEATAEPDASASATAGSRDTVNADTNDGASKGLAISGLVIAILALLAGGLALAQTRRRVGV